MRVWVLVRGKPEALAVRSQIGVRGIDHPSGLYQMTCGCGPRTAWAGAISVGGRASPTAQTHLSSHTCMSAHRQDVTVGQDMIVAQDPADRERWSGSMEEVISFPSGSATTAPIDECRLPCGLCGPIELGLGDTCKQKWDGWSNVSVVHSAHLELLLHVAVATEEAADALVSQVLGSSERRPNRSQHLGPDLI